MAATLGQILRRCRRQAGLTQGALAQSVGVDTSYISKLENDRVPPPAADTIVKMARALRTAPDDMLAISGKIPAAVSRMLGSKPAALRFFRQAADLALTDPEWERLADVLTELRRAGPPTTDGVASGLPGSVRSLFWDHDVENLHWPADRDLIIGRILASGDWRSVTWLRQQLEAEALRQWIVDRRGRGLDAKRLRFWELMVGLPHAQVDEWIRVRQQEAWGRRTQA